MKTRKIFKNMNLRHKQKGAMLVELLVACAIGAGVILITTEMNLRTRMLEAAVYDRMQTQETVRNFTALLARDANMAGSYGCLNLATSSANGSSINNTGVASYYAHGLDSNLLTVINPDSKNSRIRFGVEILSNTSLVPTKADGSAPTSILNALNSWVSNGTTTRAISSLEAGEIIFFQYGEPIGQFQWNGSTAKALNFKMSAQEMATPYTFVPFGLSSCNRLDVFSFTNMSGAEYIENRSTGVVTVKEFRFNNPADTYLTLYDRAQGADPTLGHIASELQLFRPKTAVYFVGTTPEWGKGLYAIQDFDMDRMDNYKARITLISKDITKMNAKYGFYEQCGLDTEFKDNSKIRAKYSKTLGDDQPAFISVDLTVQGNLKQISETSGQMDTNSANVDGEGSSGALRVSEYKDIILAVKGGAVCAERKDISN